jgi:iron complex outermembrane recepter protein
MQHLGRRKSTRRLNLRKKSKAKSRNLLFSVPLLSSLLLAGARVASAQVPCREIIIFDMPCPTGPDRRPQPTRKASSTTIITAEDIRRSGATNIPDLLRNVPGLDMFRLSASDVNITARGLNGRLAHRMQVFIDGRSVYEDFINLIFWHELPISLHEIDRIEISKSPAAALFGANAFSGVIHIITKSPETLKGTLVSQSAGNAGTNISDLIHAGVVGDFSYKMSFEHDQTNHFPNSYTGKSDNERGRYDYRGHGFAEYKLSADSRVSLAAGIDRFDRDFDPGLTDTLLGKPTPVYANGGLGFVKLNYSLSDLKLQFVWDRIDFDGTSAIFSRKASVLIDTYKLDGQDSWRWNENNILTAGASYQYSRFVSQFLIGPEQKQNRFAVFLQDEYTPTKELTFSLGLRVDTHPEAGVHAAPRGSVVYSPWENHIFRASIARAFRNPSIIENFVNFGVVNPFGPPLQVIGNRNFDAEEITSYELGYQFLLPKKITATVDLFYNTLHNMSPGSVLVTNPLPHIAVLSGGGGSVYGGEVALKYLFNEGLTGFANYSYQQRDFRDHSLLGAGANHKGNVGLNFTLPKGFEADLFVNSVSRTKQSPGSVAPYATVNLRLGYQFDIMGTKGNLGVGVFNLFNDKHREAPLAAVIERRITGGLQLKF